MSKTKGSTYELKIAKSLSAWWGHEFNRTPASGGLRWGAENNVAGDIVTPPTAMFPFVVECKKREGWTLENLFLNNTEIKEWWHQVVDDCERVGKTPILIFSRNRANDYIAVPYQEKALEMFEGNSNEPTMKTAIAFEDSLGDTHRFKVIVTTLSNLESNSPDKIKALYSEDNFDWRDARRIIKSSKEAESVEDLLTKI